MNGITYKTTKSGLTLCCIKKSGYVEKQAMVAVNCGSADVKLTGKRGGFTLPYGTAHYLEHKMFEKKHGNIFDDFSALGADANAYTSLDTTAYYFTCRYNFEKSLSLLAKMVTEPHLTDKGVERERGIIESEITMYEDDPGWQAYFGMLGGLYTENPVRVPIAGSKEDIDKINADTLKLLYRSMYTPDNIIVIAAGDIDQENFFEQAEKEFVFSPREKARSEFPKEDNINRVSVKKHMSVATPIFSIGYKEKNFDMPPLMRMLTSRILMDIFAGKGSVLYEKLYTSGLCTAPPTLEYICGKDYGISVISGSSGKPEILLSRLDNEIENFLSYGISEKYLNRITAKSRGELKQRMDSLSFCCSFAADCFAKSIKTLDIFDKYDSINSDELLLRLKDHFKADGLCMCEILPN